MHNCDNEAGLVTEFPLIVIAGSKLGIFIVALCIVTGFYDERLQKCSKHNECHLTKESIKERSMMLLMLIPDAVVPRRIMVTLLFCTNHRSKPLCNSLYYRRPSLLETLL